MISKITGILNKAEEEDARIQVGAFEYQVLVTELVRRQIQDRVGQEISLHTLHFFEGNPVQQGRMIPRLLGFLHESDMSFFELICTVDGIGVRKAIRVIAMPVNQIADAIQRVAADVTAESTVTIVNLPSDDLKGRIIGREGRNNNTFEQITGIDDIVDDTPGSIVISGFDMIRRYIAKMTLERLIVDGRIHPARIEETYEKVKEDVNNIIKELGEKAVFEAGVTGLHPNLVKLLGRLKFRISYGQNVLKHSMEVAVLAGALAAELGADVNVCKKAGLLHDIGKAVDHEIQGNHVKIGAEIAKKFGLAPDVVHAIEAHDGEIEPKTVEAMLVEAANLISNARPGASKENLDTFIRRMQELENLCMSFGGVKKAYALQAGNEVRIFVNADDLDDLGSKRLSHDVARKIERDFQHPNPIKVNVIREIRRDATAD